MFNEKKQQIEWGGKVLELSTGKIARQADGCVIATYGGTVVMCTVVSDKKVKEGVDFLPLTVIYREMAFAAGKIPGGFHKREGRPSEKEVLVSRLIDRPIRPLFPENYYHETQVVCTVLCHDMENDPDVVSLIATSAALAISGIEFHGPIAGCRIGYINGEYVLNPTVSEIEVSQLDLVIAGTEDSVLMVEAGASELSEEVMLDALDYGHEAYKKVVHFISDFARSASKPRREVAPIGNEELGQKIKEMSREDFIEAYKEQNKQERSEKLAFVRAAVKEKLAEQGYNELTINFYLKKAEQDIVRGDIINHGTRIDNRKTDQIRKIESEVGILGKAHGSALFTRGETQALAVTTLGTTQDEQIVDLLQGEMRENFMLHYNFPPYSVGEATQMKPPGRREIGHGKLAWRAVQSVLPSKESFPYTIRIVSEITESNGSSSMATVCGASLSLMDAGVPIIRPVAGIAMGLIKEGDKFVVLSDISGDEDYLGDMDFKVAGTDQGVTALQMDIKIRGITLEIMNVALRQAKEGRMHILQKMSGCISESRTGLNENAPTITSVIIPKDKIREVIGSGGSMIRKICEVSGAKIDIEDNGTVKIASNNAKSSAKALEMVNEIVLEPQKGQMYNGIVVKILEFGAFVKFMGAREGLVHVSEISRNRVNKVTDVLSEGEEVKVVVLGMDNRGKIKLSMKYVDQTTGELSDDFAEAADNEDARSAMKRRAPRTGDEQPRYERNDRYERSSDRGDNRGGDNRYDRNNSDRNDNKKKKFFA